MTIKQFYERLKELTKDYPNKYVGLHLADRNEFTIDEPLSAHYYLGEEELCIYMANDDYGYRSAYPLDIIKSIDYCIAEDIADDIECFSLSDIETILNYDVYIVNGKDVQATDCLDYDEFEIVPCLDECTQPKSETETDNSFSDLKVLVDNVAYYRTMKRQICLMKKNSLKRIKEFLEKLPTYSEINFTGEILDFNWQGMALSIYPSSDGYFLGDAIEMWNDETCTFLGAFTHVSEVECAIEEKIDCIINQLENLKGHCEDFCDDDESIWKKDINALNVAIDCIKEFSKGRA